MGIWTAVREKRLIEKRNSFENTLEEIKSLRKRFSASLVYGLTKDDYDQGISALIKATNVEIRRLAAQTKHHEGYMDSTDIHDEVIHLARRITEEGRQLKIVMDLDVSAHGTPF